MALLVEFASWLDVLWISELPPTCFPGAILDWQGNVARRWATTRTAWWVWRRESACGRRHSCGVSSDRLQCGVVVRTKLSILSIPGGDPPWTPPLPAALCLQQSRWVTLLVLLSARWPSKVCRRSIRVAPVGSVGCLAETRRPSRSSDLTLMRTGTFHYTKQLAPRG